MLILITGVPGSGKSLYAVQLLQNYIDANQKLIEQGSPPRDIFSDIDGLSIEGVKKSPDDWRDCPDGSIVFYDECQQKFGPDGQGRSSRPDIQELETHRHRGFDIILITQHPKLLHAHIRRLIGRHYQIFRMHGGETAKIFQRDGQMDIDKVTALEKQDNFMWSYNKDLYDKYKSATVHTHKKQLPHWFMRSLIGVAALLAIVVIGGYFTYDFFSGQYFGNKLVEEEKPQQVAVTKREITSEKPVTIKPTSRPVACMSNNDKCVCYDETGYLIEQPYFQCIENTLGTPSFIDFKPATGKRAVASADS